METVKSLIDSFTVTGSKYDYLIGKTCVHKNPTYENIRGKLIVSMVQKNWKDEIVLRVKNLDYTKPHETIIFVLNEKTNKFEKETIIDTYPLEKQIGSLVKFDDLIWED